MAQRLARDLPPTVPGIPDRDGYLVWPRECNPGLVEHAVREARARVERAVVRGSESGPRRQALYTRRLTAEELSPDSDLLRLACDATLVGVVARYMGHLPLLDSICLWYSPNDELLRNRTGSQYFHIDPTGHQEVKVFVNLNEVTPSTGPVTLVPAHASRQLDRFFGPESGSLADELVTEKVGAANVVQLTGPAGTISFADTSSCFHLGSRPGTSERTLLHFHFVSPFAPRFPLRGPRRTQYASLAEPGAPAWTRHLLGASRRGHGDRPRSSP